MFCINEGKTKLQAKNQTISIIDQDSPKRPHVADLGSQLGIYLEAETSIEELPPSDNPVAVSVRPF